MSVNFTEFLPADRGTIDMKHIKQDFRSKAWVWLPGWTKGVGQRPKLFFFQNMIMLHIKLKGLTHAATFTRRF